MSASGPIPARSRISKPSGSQVAALFWLSALALFAWLAPQLIPQSPQDPVGPPLTAPSAAHLLGTDHLGRDLLARMAAGGRLSLGAALAATALTLVVGGPAGLLAALLGAIFERGVVWISNVLLAIPGLLLALLVIAATGPGLAAVVLSVGVGGMPSFARITRSVAAQLNREGYVLAARALGARRLWIAWEHILPNAWPQLRSLATTHFAWAFLGITTLTFLGLAGDPSTPEWGAMLDASRTYLLEAPWAALWPALAISVTILAAHALAGRGLAPGTRPR